MGKVRLLPNSPGVYTFFGPKRAILYIGKATSLKNRVRSYFAKNIGEKRSPLIEKMVVEAVNIKFQKTDSVLEAFILESNLIKKYSPPYNTADKDQKSFNYAVITKEKYPRVLLIRERELIRASGAEYSIDTSFGPFPHGKELKEALKIIRKIFPFRDKCREDQEKPCFNTQIGLCLGICTGAISKKEYAKTIKHIKTFFEGNKKKLVKDLEKEMKNLAKEKEFEKASEIKNKIFALKHIQDVALIKKGVVNPRSQNFRIEAYDIAHLSGTNMVGVMTVVENGEPQKSDYRMFKIKGQSGIDDTRALMEILGRRFGHPEWPLPSFIVADGGIAQLNAVEHVLENLKMKIPAVAVTKDEKHKAREILGIEKLKDLEIEGLKNQILLANNEAHRFAIKFHRKLRDIM